MCILRRLCGVKHNGRTPLRFFPLSSQLQEGAGCCGGGEVRGSTCGRGRRPGVGSRGRCAGLRQSSLTPGTFRRSRRVDGSAFADSVPGNGRVRQGQVAVVYYYSYSWPEFGDRRGGLGRGGLNRAARIPHFTPESASAGGGGGGGGALSQESWAALRPPEARAWARFRGGIPRGPRASAPKLRCSGGQGPAQSP